MFRPSQLLSAEYRPTLSQLWAQISETYQADEATYLAELLALVEQPSDELQQVTRHAEQLVTQVRQEHHAGEGLDAFLQQYSLDTQEGIILMCLAEALLRIPDGATADALIKDKLSGADWAKHLKSSESMLVNASTWGLMLTGKVITLDKGIDGEPANLLNRMVTRLGEPVVRKAMYAAMKIMGKQFVLGRNVKEALKSSKSSRKAGYTHSYDMLGESALTMADADRYLASYQAAIAALGAAEFDEELAPRPTISVKLSALYPRYEASHKQQAIPEMSQRLATLVSQARSLNIGIQVDAEEADRHEMMLQIFEHVYRSDAAKGWGNFGLVVQAYAKWALPSLVWLTEVARSQGDTIPIRLVKGAYWDSEIKLSQQRGLTCYPVYTRKSATDCSYLACAKYLLSARTEQLILPQFATHNAQTVVAIQRLAGNRPFEFQRLWGMGDELYGTLLMTHATQAVRIYAPVGEHKDLLPYLVRRLLENGANTSFVHKLVDPNTPTASLAEHPLHNLQKAHSLINTRIPLPATIYPDRSNSAGPNLDISAQAEPFFAQLQEYQHCQWQAHPIIDGESVSGATQTVCSPRNRDEIVGQVQWATTADCEHALMVAHQAFPNWRNTSVELRAKLLETLADQLQAHQVELIALCTREAGKQLHDGIDEVREAIDFCRYYAVEARKLFRPGAPLPGPTGELNELFVQGRGVFVCISPWNFPLAIFLGQISAALVTGNTVIAKPAEQTSLIAHRTVELMLEVGFPADVIQLLPGSGKTLGTALTQDNRVTGVCFTGSTQTAQLINRSLAARDGAIATLIAETGGQNCMLVDSTSLPEQVVKDVVQSAFASAGQRCSALRVLYLQAEIADKVIALLAGAMQELNVGDTWYHQTDIGPVIDTAAQQQLLQHIADMQSRGRLIAQSPMPEETNTGSYVPATAVEIESINWLSKEQFGPVLHVIRYKKSDLNDVIAQINATGFGLTLGIHSRNTQLALTIADRVNVGNVYINRNQIGAMVGTQPFGGQGLSGTGPKAGGPRYLPRFITEKTRSNNITAVGGNASLLSLGDA
ncbi:bifunctional proline dehydrogenase/L-glutamate gamma-semialdehyde dehydrogenase PutA [Corallincola luteus]|uniref:Bifunctional protein PutA n=1 Tax=Corallincola luteus TaxID=1775177 RepID=A0ABY2ANW9_9GAMM|nr:bifunctional proline dehydrogenase/L-glutamate gamma-semialdehyde dehydrogenase PutA [Corallincola luteus]TCI04889.1 bifunctional proline dehydrogenase/L-glutamate gamma-semialdehyde dehydrogenase PutA [Corallincola luteus]